MSIQVRNKTGGGMATLITGATDGIGLALARIYEQNGDRLILVGRRPISSLEDGLFSRDTYCQIDLANIDEVGTMDAFLESKEIGSIDRLILNAGTGFYGRTADQSAEDVRRIVSVNLSSSIALIHKCWSRLAAAGGKVILIGSVVSTLPCPDYAVYAATKAAVDGLARSLRYELEPGVSVKVIHPGATRTGLHEKIGVDDRVDWRRFPSADTVASRIADRIDAPGWRSIPAFIDRVLWTVGKRLPRVADYLMRRR